MSQTLKAALASAGQTFLVYLRQPRNAERIAQVSEMAAAAAAGVPSFGSVLVDVDDLSQEELSLIGTCNDIDAALLGRGPGLNRRRLATYHLDAVDDPLEMFVAWGLDR
jgi:hypothetical protein